MALLTKTEAPGAYVSALTLLTMTAAEVAGDEIVITPKDIVVVHNTDGSAHNITVTSVADRFNRTEDITSHSVPAGEIHILGPMQLEGWKNPSGRLEVTADSTTMEIGIIEQE